MIAHYQNGRAITMQRLYKKLTTPYTSVSVVGAPHTQFAGYELATNFSFMKKNFLRTIIYMWGIIDEKRKVVTDFFAIDYLVNPNKIVKYYGRPHLFSHEAPKHKIYFSGTAHNLIYELIKLGVKVNEHEELLTVRKAALSSKRTQEEYRHFCWLRYYNLKELIVEKMADFEYPRERVERKLVYLKNHSFS